MWGAPTVRCSLYGETYEAEEGIIKFSEKVSFTNSKSPLRNLFLSIGSSTMGLFSIFLLYLRVNFSLDISGYDFLICDSAEECQIPLRPRCLLGDRFAHFLTICLPMMFVAQKIPT